MLEIKIRPVIIQTRNGNNTNHAVAVAKEQGGAAVALEGTAGAGKTTIAQYKAANEDGVFIRYLTIFGKSGLDLLQTLCTELGMTMPPGRRVRCFSEVVEKLRGSERVVYIDEAHRMPQDLLNVVIDLMDATLCPFVLIGEQELHGVLETNKRIWSRCCQIVQFEPVTMPEVIVYTREAAGLNLSKEVAALIHKESGGDFRLLKRAVYTLVKLVNSKGTREIDLELARLAASAGLKGPGSNGNKAR